MKKTAKTETQSFVPTAALYRLYKLLYFISLFTLGPQGECPPKHTLN